MQEYKIVKKVLMDFCDEDYIIYNEEENSFHTPFCIMSGYDDVWNISFDLDFFSDSRDITFLSNFIIELMSHQIMIDTDSNYYSIFDEEDKFIDFIWENHIYKKMMEEHKEYEEVKDELLTSILKEYNSKNETAIIETSLEDKSNLN